MARVTRKPTLEPLKLFHVDRKGYIHFQYDPLAGSSMELGERTIEPVAAKGYRGTFPVSILETLDQWIPELREQFLDQLKFDGYAGIHTAYRPKTWPTQEDFRRINAAQLDLDYGEDLEYFDAVSRLADMTATGHLPPFSVVVNTGHGAHVFWLLRGGEDDDEPELPPRSFSRNRRLAVQVNGAIAQRVRDTYPELKPDDNFVHITTHTRVEGSTNTRTGVHVAFTVNYSPDRVPPRYTLGHLCDHFGVPTMRDTYRKTRTSNGTKTPKRRSGWVARYEKPLQDFQLVRAYMEARGGFPKGTRRHAVYFVVTLMRPCGYSPGDVMAEALAVARRCHPPLPEAEARAQVKSAMKRQRQPRNAKIADQLGVTLELADQLELQQIRPDFVAGKPLKGRTAKRQARHTFLLELADAHGNPLPFSFRQLEAELKAAGHGAAVGTIHGDLKKLKLNVQKSTSARRDAHPHQPTLPS